MTHITTTDTLFMLVYRTGVYSEMPATWADLNTGNINAGLFISEAEAEAARTDAVAALEAAGNGETELARNLRNARIITLSRFILDFHNVKEARNAMIDTAEQYRQAIETYLEEGVEGSLDPEGFMKETSDLAEAIGFDWMTETEVTVTATVLVKHRRGEEGALDEAFSISAETTSWGIAESVEVVDYEVTL